MNAVEKHSTLHIERRTDVAQIFNLPYRRIAFCFRTTNATPPGLETPADFKSAIRQSATLRYAGGEFVSEVASHS